MPEMGLKAQCLNSFHPQFTFEVGGAVITPFWRQAVWGTERPGSQPKVAQWGSGSACSKSTHRSYLLNMFNYLYKHTYILKCGNPLQYSCLENYMDREAWQAIVHGTAKSWTCLSTFHMHTHTHTRSYIYLFWKEMTLHISKWKQTGITGFH